MMKAITILEPWASLIACGAKKIETRGWATKYRGKIAIHAGKSKKYTAGVIAEFNGIPLPNEFRLNYGKVVAIADLVDCAKVIDFNNVLNLPILERDLTRKVITANELNFGDLSLGRYAWIIENVQAIEPISAKGQQGLWNWDGGQYD